MDPLSHSTTLYKEDTSLIRSHSWSIQEEVTEGM